LKAHPVKHFFINYIHFYHFTWSYSSSSFLEE